MFCRVQLYYWWTEYYLKYVLHLLKQTCNMRLRRWSTDLREHMKCLVCFSIHCPQFNSLVKTMLLLLLWNTACFDETKIPVWNSNNVSLPGRRVAPFPVRLASGFHRFSFDNHPFHAPKKIYYGCQKFSVFKFRATNRQISNFFVKFRKENFTFLSTFYSTNIYGLYLVLKGVRKNRRLPFYLITSLLFNIFSLKFYGHLVIKVSPI